MLIADIFIDKSQILLEEAAQKIGIHQITLQRWIKTRKVNAPDPTLIGAVGFRLWSLDEMKQLRL
jgi:predicted DNA-binding transcriptional regulator AlpA